MRRFRASVEAIRARVALRRGDLAEADAFLGEAERAAQLRDVAVLATVHVPFAQVAVALARGDAARAADLAREATERLRGMGVRAYLPEALLLEAAALRSVGRGAEARASLDEARDLATSLGARWTLWRVLAALGARRDASAIVRDIADRAGEFRASFLALPEVRALIEAAT